MYHYPTVSLLDSPPMIVAGSDEAAHDVDIIDPIAVSAMVDKLSQMFPRTGRYFFLGFLRTA